MMSIYCRGWHDLTQNMVTCMLKIIPRRHYYSCGEQIVSVPTFPFTTVSLIHLTPSRSRQYILHSTPYARPNSSILLIDTCLWQQRGKHMRKQGETVLLLCRKAYCVVNCPPTRHKTNETHCICWTEGWKKTMMENFAVQLCFKTAGASFYTSQQSYWRNMMERDCKAFDNLVIRVSPNFYFFIHVPYCLGFKFWTKASIYLGHSMFPPQFPSI